MNKLNKNIRPQILALNCAISQQFNLYSAMYWNLPYFPVRDRGGRNTQQFSQLSLVFKVFHNFVHEQNYTHNVFNFIKK